MSITGGTSNMRVRLVIGCILVGFFCWQVSRNSDEPGTIATSRTSMIPPAVAYSAPDIRPGSLSNDELAKTDPLGLLKVALQRYQNSVSDYTCDFTKQERIRGILGQEQQIAVRFREMPFSVLMEWTRNPGDARRVLFVEGMWQNDEGQPLAKIEPQGAIARLLVKSVMLPINGPQARAVSRRTVDKFGFGNALKLIIDYAASAIKTGQGSLTYEGETTINGRKAWTFKRVLPYTGDGGAWPDRVLVVHIDREWLLPVACYTYADDAQQVMLARYEFANIRLNTGLDEKAFDAEANGF